MKKQPIGLIHDEAGYEAALAEYEAYFDDEPAEGSADADRLEILGLVLARYEEEHWPFEGADPVETLTLVMQARGLTQSDLATVLGSRARASEIMRRRRSLSLDHIRKLHKAWGVPAETLIGQAA